MDNTATNVYIDEVLNWWINDKNGLVEKGFIKGANTVLDTGKNNLAKLVAGLDTKYVDSMWAKMSSGSITTRQLAIPSSPSNSNTLVLDQYDLVGQPSQYTVPGTYIAIMTGNDSVGSLTPYNSISTNIVLQTDQELRCQVRWVFSGLTNSGNNICAARLGNGGYWWSSPHDYPLSKLVIFNSGVAVNTIDVHNSVTNNTLIADMDEWQSAMAFDSCQYKTTSSDILYNVFDGISGFIITVTFSESINVFAKYVFN